VNVAGTVCVVTGGGSGIGAALCRRLADAGAARVVVVDRAWDAARAVADEIGGEPAGADVTDPAAIAELVDRIGVIDLFASNAGIATGGGLDDDEMWQRVLAVNTMAHVYAARAVLPGMLARGSGYLVQTASAAGLLTSPGDAPYAVSKHAAVGLAEWLAVTYGGRGIRVSVVCPMGVDTPLLMDGLRAGEPGSQAVAASGAIITADQVADTVLDGIAQERFLIVPHPEVATFWAQKASDPDRWLAGVRRLIDTKKE
jgi:NAD(P)-dependent dehydrogenase (short-subunit alcohol dehydrogenase family)